MARRVYATVLNAAANSDGHKQQDITCQSGQRQKELISRVYEEANIDPLQVTYVEAHGIGTTFGDAQELDAIAHILCPNRKEPLLIGSIKSNIGHTESSSGLCSVAKVLLAMEEGIIPGNLHFKEPNEGVPALKDGRFRVVDRNTPWKGGLIAIHSYGLGGSNAHVVLRPASPSRISIPTCKDVHRLVTVSGRTEEAVKAILDQVSHFLMQCKRNVESSTCCV